MDPNPHDKANAKMNQWLRFSNAYETSMQVTANNPKIVTGFIDESSLIHRPGTLVPIGVEKSSYHQLSQIEIGSDNPCSRHLSSKQFAVAGSIAVIDRSLFLDCSFDQ
jgi:hypothetical protein